MSLYVFTGPSLPAAMAHQLLPEAIYLPPVAQGDVYRVALRRPRAIALIDGYFQGIPSVRHKEILWAMSQGIHVYGAASMGALRAAELAAFGMIGVGTVFAAYRDGQLEDDDEVAVVHGPAGSGYAALSEALVNIRATLTAAVQQSIISAATGEALAQLGKQRFHSQRSYAQLLQDAATAQLSAAELDRFRNWFPDNIINQKQQDACALLATLRDWLSTAPEPRRVSYHFEATTIWEAARLLAVPVLPDGATEPIWLPLEELFDEWRLGGGYRLDSGREIRCYWLAALADPLGDAHLADHLRALCDYPQLTARALAKQATLAHLGILRPQLDDVPLGPGELIAWYYAQYPVQIPPADLADAWRTLGFADPAACQRALVGEYLYLNATGDTAEACL